MILDKIDELLKEVIISLPKTQKILNSCDWNTWARRERNNFTDGRLPQCCSRPEENCRHEDQQAETGHYHKRLTNWRNRRKWWGENDNIDLTRTAPIPFGHPSPAHDCQDQIIWHFPAYRKPPSLKDQRIDDDLHVFTKLNFAADHPARHYRTHSLWSRTPTMWPKNILLRSHTSNDQSHYMETHQPPIRVICPGRVYRNRPSAPRALLLPSAQKDFM